MGLGIFIAQSLLERTGAHLTFDNLVEGGAHIVISWNRANLETAPRSRRFSRSRSARSDRKAVSMNAIDRPHRAAGGETLAGPLQGLPESDRTPVDRR